MPDGQLLLSNLAVGRVEMCQPGSAALIPAQYLNGIAGVTRNFTSSPGMPPWEALASTRFFCAN